MQLNAVGKHKFGYIQESVKKRSRSANNTCVEEMTSCCKLVRSFITKGRLVIEKQGKRGIHKFGYVQQSRKSRSRSDLDQRMNLCCRYRYDVILYEVFITTGPSCSKLTTLLINVALKFQMYITEICQYFLLKK